jgi:hypothetical protein
MSREPKTRNAKPLQRKTISTRPPDTWEEVFTALDAAEVRDGFMVDRDLRPAEERPVMDAFFGAKSGRARKS